MGFLSFEVLLGIGLLENLQPRELQQRGGIAGLVQCHLLRLLRHDFAADQVIEQLRALIHGEFRRRGLPAVFLA